jgi:DNA-binding response OmpR family regulator
MANILLIEDDEALRGVLATTLRDAGHAVREAGNGRDGLKLFAQEPADVVVSDLIMPEQEGIETITMLRKSHAKLPIIAISGGFTNAPHYLKAAAKLGANRVMSKPFSTADLNAAITEVLAETRGGEAV